MSKPASYDRWTPRVQVLYDLLAQGDAAALRELIALLRPGAAQADRLAANSVVAELGGLEFHGDHAPEFLATTIGILHEPGLSAEDRRAAEEHVAFLLKYVTPKGSA